MYPGDEGSIPLEPGTFLCKYQTSWTFDLSTAYHLPPYATAVLSPKTVSAPAPDDPNCTWQPHSVLMIIDGGANSSGTTDSFEQYTDGGFGVFYFHAPDAPSPGPTPSPSPTPSAPPCDQIYDSTGTMNRLIAGNANLKALVGAIEEQGVTIRAKYDTTTAALPVPSAGAQAVVGEDAHVTPTITNRLTDWTITFLVNRINQSQHDQTALLYHELLHIWFQAVLPCSSTETQLFQNFPPRSGGTATAMIGGKTYSWSLDPSGGYSGYEHLLIHDILATALPNGDQTGALAEAFDFGASPGRSDADSFAKQNAKTTFPGSVPAPSPPATSGCSRLCQAYKGHSVARMPLVYQKLPLDLSSSLIPGYAYADISTYYVYPH